MNVGDFLVKKLGPGAIIGVIHRQDPKKLGEELADIVDEMFDKEFGDRKSERIQKELIPFITHLSKSLCDRLEEDQKMGSS